MKNKNIIKITDKSELAALVAEIKKNGGVANLIIGDVINIHYGDDHSGRSVKVDEAEPLSYYIRDAEMLANVIKIAETGCTRMMHVKRLVYDYLVARGLSESMLRSKGFIEALLPHLKQIGNKKVLSVQKAFRRVK